MTSIFHLTHKGWFGLCPVYLGDFESDEPLVCERHWFFAPLMILSELIFDLCFFAQDMAGAEPTGWPIRVTGRLDEPIELEIASDVQ